ETTTENRRADQNPRSRAGVLIGAAVLGRRLILHPRNPVAPKTRERHFNAAGLPTRRCWQKCGKCPLQVFAALSRCLRMKKLLPLLLLPLLFGGCAATVTNLSAKQQSRNATHLYRVEASFNSRQQSLRWDSIKPQVVVGNDLYPMHPVPLMTNRWEGLVPAP